MTSIKMAKREDLPRVVQLIMKRGEDFDYEARGMPLPDIDVVTDTVYRNWIISPCYVVWKDDEIIGLASTTLSTFGWSKVPHLGLFMVYVLKEHRKFGIIKKLYKSVQDYASLHGLVLHDSYIAIDRVDGRRRLMRALDFEESGFLLTYRGDK